jgi:hypothetical protein
MTTRGRRLRRHWCGRARLDLTLWSIALLVISGCTSAVQGDASPSPELAREMARQRAPLPAKTALGEFATIDYCDLLEPVSLPEGWEIAERWSRLEKCDALVVKDEWSVTVVVGNLADRRDRTAVWTRDRSRPLPRHLYIERPARESDDRSCTRGIAFPDHVSLILMGSDEVGDPSRREVCEVVDLIIKSVVEELVADWVVGHFVEFDDKSLVESDVCDLVASDLIAATTGSSAQDRHRSVSGHECTWTGNGTGPAVIVAIDLITGSPVSAAVPVVKLAGRSSVIDHGDDICIVSTEYAEFPDTYDEGDHEGVHVVVLGVPGAEACSMARKIAKGVWPKLPR